MNRVPAPPTALWDSVSAPAARGSAPRFAIPRSCPVRWVGSVRRWMRGAARWSRCVPPRGRSAEPTAPPAPAPRAVRAVCASTTPGPDRRFAPSSAGPSRSARAFQASRVSCSPEGSRSAGRPSEERILAVASCLLRASSLSRRFHVQPKPELADRLRPRRDPRFPRAGAGAGHVHPQDVSAPRPGDHGLRGPRGRPLGVAARRAHDPLDDRRLHVVAGPRRVHAGFPRGVEVGDEHHRAVDAVLRARPLRRRRGSSSRRTTPGRR